MAIVQPNEMNFTDKKFSMIISGSPGTGKTTFALSAPNPVLIDFDKGVSRVKAQHRKPTIIAATYEEVKQDLQDASMKDCETIIIDTGGSFITFLQDYAMRDNPAVNKQKNGAISLKGFGAVKAEFVRFTNILQYTYDKNIIYVFHTVEQRDGDVTKQRLLCEGAARDIVWQPCDAGCFLQMIGNERVAGFSPTEEYFAKGCYGISGVMKIPNLDDGSTNNCLTLLFAKMRDNLAAETEFFKDAEDTYRAAMEQAHIIIENIADVHSANASTEQFKSIVHALTSEREIKAMLKKRLAGLGITLVKGEYIYAG